MSGAAQRGDADQGEPRRESFRGKHRGDTPPEDGCMTTFSDADVQAGIAYMVPMSQ
ncbi:MAG: hypothetical protein ACR2O5_05190 [Thiogranum sp.]